jgi:hypothetical protein
VEIDDPLEAILLCYHYAGVSTLDDTVGVSSTPARVLLSWRGQRLALLATTQTDHAAVAARVTRSHPSLPAPILSPSHVQRHIRLLHASAVAGGASSSKFYRQHEALRREMADMYLVDVLVEWPCVPPEASTMSSSQSVSCFVG